MSELKSEIGVLSELKSEIGILKSEIIRSTPLEFSVYFPVIREHSKFKTTLAQVMRSYGAVGFVHHIGVDGAATLADRVTHALGGSEFATLENVFYRMRCYADSSES